MQVICTGVATLRVRETGEVLTVTPDLLDWDQEGVGERNMGMEARYWAEVELESPSTKKAYAVTWQLWEYPLGVENTKETEVPPALELISDFEYRLAHAPDSGDEEGASFEGDQSSDFVRFGEPFPRASKSRRQATPAGSERSDLHAQASLNGTHSESLAAKDCLGRQHIAEALRVLITQRGNNQHFSIGIFGYWGTGKSSLIHQVAAVLKERHPDVVIAEFNAWKNEKASSLGAMLAQSVVDALTEKLSLRERLKLATKLSISKVGWLRSAIQKDADGLYYSILQSPRLWVMLPLALTFLMAVLILWALPVPEVIKWLGIPIVGWTAVLGISRYLQDNLFAIFRKVDTNKFWSLLRFPSYSEHRGLLGEINSTLTDLCALTLGKDDSSEGRTLLLVIDDLDRCGISTVKEAFDIVRLVADIPRVIAVVAIDERIAFAAVEKHSDQFSQASYPPSRVAREYLAKVLQVSISLPEVGDSDVQRFVEEVLFEESEELATQSSAMPEILIDEQIDTEQSLKGNRQPATAKPLAIYAQHDLPEERDLFRELSLAYNFRNPRLMWRLRLSWRLLKSLYFGEVAYRFSQAEIGMRLLFWREYRLQHDADRRDELDRWLESGCEGDGPQDLVSALGSLVDNMPGTFMGMAQKKILELTDAVLLPASPSLPR